MTQMEGDGPRGGSGSEHAKVLSEVIAEQKRRQEARDAAATPKSDSSLVKQVGLVVSSVFFFYLLFFSPSWIVPTAAPQISAPRVEANLRWYLFTVGQAIEDFRNSNERLPESVEEITVAKPGTTYDPIGQQDYRIGHSDGEVSVNYTSSESFEEFLGNATDEVLRGIL